MKFDPTDAQDVYKDAGKNVLFTTLKLNRDNQKEEQEKVANLVSREQAILRSMNIRYPDDHLKVTFGFSNSAWEYLFPEAKKPAELENFEPIKGPKYTAPETDADIFIHIRADSEAIVYEVADLIRQYYRDFTEVTDETKGFRYFEGRSIIGFVDGTENPEVQKASSYAIIGDEDPDFINGSYAFAQKYIHDMDAWNGLKTEDQEKAIGRRKMNDLELEDNDKLENSHNVASQDNDDGIEHKIVRMNVPFSNPSEGLTGTYFIGYARHWTVTKRMLENMFGQSDRLLDFSDPVTGNVFFIPSITTLNQIVDGELPEK
ncbi:Dyp-type peroxidase [Apilactobacillus micheneri]|uniref:Dyp-type peroxidase n=1 Tax=Apilactobacillus micheneri TaxID=1899430 RepID=A0A9Q8MTC5_9LACO|nr:Dyp-type peroxidase [Apilactobacillus micheneri]TPR39185.1 Dyp-type peroxidase [Apilactobacillus micheneri]TPR43090.1 Dyp-type peroxidase [Apilactobacillus micheneri]TPR44070.1 Dyp-type peroxidase [Apilactobacillus micheneri]